MEKYNNKGYTLVELVIVIAIIAIVTAGASTLFIGWQKQYLNDCVKKIDTALSAAKVEGTSKEATEMTIKPDDEGLYYLYMTGTNDRVLGDKKVEIYYVTQKNPTPVLVTKDNPLTISYDRASGGFEPIDVEGTKTYCTEIQVVRGSKTVNIKLSISTGKHSIER